MGDAAGNAAHGLHLLSLIQLIAEQLFLGHVSFDGNVVDDGSTLISDG
jgi:hypothetical protein